MTKKWDFFNHEYEEVENTPGIPLVADLDEYIQCANCHDPLLYGDSYTSKQWHNEVGLGYSVCEKCYNEEWRLYHEAEAAIKKMEG